MDENISVASQCVAKEKALWLQKEVEIDVLRETLKNEKHCDSLSSKLNEKEEKLSKLNTRNFDQRMEQEKN